MSVEQIVKRLNRFLRRWINYFRIANCKTIVSQLDGVDKATVEDEENEGVEEPEGPA